MIQWLERFPEIAKAVGAKYLKRIPKAGGGYRYIYKEPKSEKAKEYKEKQMSQIADKLINIYRGSPEMAKQILSGIYSEEKQRRIIGMIEARIKLRGMVGGK